MYVCFISSGNDFITKCTYYIIHLISAYLFFVRLKLMSLKWSHFSLFRYKRIVPGPRVVYLHLLKTQQEVMASTPAAADPVGVYCFYVQTTRENISSTFNRFGSGSAKIRIFLLLIRIESLTFLRPAFVSSTSYHWCEAYKYQYKKLYCAATVLVILVIVDSVNKYS